MKEYSLKAFKKHFAENGIFYTSEKLATTLIRYIDIDFYEAYDPTCGRGNLLRVLPDEILKYGQELNQSELEVARSELVNFTGRIGDTLADDKFGDKKFEVILANPPFSIKYDGDSLKNDVRFKDLPVMPPNSKADYAFLAHILYHLEDDGVAIVLNFPGILYRKAREGKIRQWLVDNNYIDRVVHVPPKNFEDTAIATCILVLKKNKKSTDVLFEDLELDMQRVVKLEEIKENDYILSVNCYIQKEEIKEKIDPLALNESIREVFKKKLKDEIYRDYLINELDNDLKSDTDKYCDELIEIVKESRREANYKCKGIVSV